MIRKTAPIIIPRGMDDLLEQRRDAWRLTDCATDRDHRALADVQAAWANRLERLIAIRAAALSPRAHRSAT